MKEIRPSKKPVLNNSKYVFVIFLTASSSKAYTSRGHFSSTLFLTTHLITEVNAMGYVSSGMKTNHLSSRPGMGRIRLRICFCHQTFINSGALLMSLRALMLAHVDRKPCLYQKWNSSFLLITLQYNDIIYLSTPGTNPVHSLCIMEEHFSSC